MADGAVFLTGATGALGSWIAQRALADGRSVKALARGTANASARQRVEQSIAIVSGEAFSGTLEVVEGDLYRGRIDLEGVDLVIHCAACTSFHERSADASRRTNVLAVGELLKLAAEQQVPVVHVSTAYVCGTRDGVALEDELDVGQTFNNVYERTKFEGESLVHEWSSRTGIPAIVIRPGIVLGDQAGGRAVRFSTLYHLMSALDAVGPSRNAQTLRLIGNPDVTKNIIPVDYFADVVWHIIGRGLPGTYQIAHPDPISMRELSAFFSELFNVDLRLVTAQEFACNPASPLERMCGHIMAPYRPYMTGREPVFDQRRTLQAVCGGIAPPACLDVGYFKKLLGYGRQVNWGRDVVVQSIDNEQIDLVREYFDVFLAQRMGQNLLADLKRLSARFIIAMKDRPGLYWCLDVQSGVLTSISRHQSASACAFTLDSETFLQIAAGRLPPQRAFFAGRIKITGNIELGLKVATVLARFFSAFPFVAETV